MEYLKGPEFNFTIGGLIAAYLFPSLATSAGLAGLILTEICALIILNTFHEMVPKTTDSLDFTFAISSVLISSRIFGQAFFPALIAPFVGVGVLMAIAKGLESLDAGFNQFYNSISTRIMGGAI